MSVTRTFLAWHRKGLPVALSGAPGAGSARSAVPARVTLRGGPTTVIPVELAGPGDIAGLDPREVRRTEPHDGCADFEPAYLPYVELLSTDLPWRFSPLGPQTNPLPDPEHPAAVPASQRRVPPWLALVVVPTDAATLTPAAPGRLPILACDTAQLPDPGELWAWAHVQVSTVDGQDPAVAVDDPNRAVARLICPRRLVAGTRYLACVVPTFAAGRTAVGATVSGDPLAPAWGGTPRAELPVYFSFAFTSAQEGSFETLARRLRPRPAPAASSGRFLHTDAPGWGVPAAARPPTRMQGALRPLPGAQPPDPTDPSPAEDAPDAALAQEIATAISSPGSGLTLRPPLYGQDYAGGATVLAPDAAGWLAQLNTDPRRRLAAGLAAWAVAVEQEDLSDRAWQQLDDAGLRQTSAADPALGSLVRTALVARHDTGAVQGLPAALVRMARPGGPLSPAGLAAASVAARPSGAAPGLAGVAASAVRFAPTFSDPAYTYLRAVAPEWLLPGVESLAEDSIVVLRTNPAFTESFLVGLNHALARELVWRRYPLEPTATMFRRFWAAAPAAPDTALPPLSEWNPASDLGTHTPATDQLVLLVRGALLRRFPTAAVYLSGTRSDGSEVHLGPSLTASLGAGTALFGFPMTADEALHPPGGDPSAPTSWSVVLQEAVDHARFGCDEPPSGGASTPLDGWQDLDWNAPQLRGRTHVPIAGPLAGISRPLTGGPSPVAVPTATWGLDAGQLAVILQQPAFRIRIPVALWLQHGPQS